jgi:hypothetical protein
LENLNDIFESRRSVVVFVGFIVFSERMALKVRLYSLAEEYSTYEYMSLLSAAKDVTYITFRVFLENEGLIYFAITKVELHFIFYATFFNQIWYNYCKTDPHAMPTLCNAQITVRVSWTTSHVLPTINLHKFIVFYKCFL